MVTKVAFCSTSVRCFSKARPLAHPRVLKAMQSTSTKFFEENKCVEKPPEGWKEKFIAIADKEELEIEKDLQSSNHCLSFEDFKNQRLISFEQYAKARHEYCDCEMIDKGYELYCEGKYQKYLMEKGQVISSILL